MVEIDLFIWNGGLLFVLKTGDGDQTDLNDVETKNSVDENKKRKKGHMKDKLPFPRIALILLFHSFLRNSSHMKPVNSNSK